MEVLAAVINAIYNEGLLFKSFQQSTPNKNDLAREPLWSLSKYADELDCCTENSENRSPNMLSFPPLTPNDALDNILWNMPSPELRKLSLIDIEEVADPLSPRIVLFDNESFINSLDCFSPQYMKWQKKKKKNKDSKTISTISTIDATTPALVRGATTALCY